MDANERRARAGEEAAHWCVRLQDGDMPLGERQQFIDWLRESPLHVGEMLRAAQVQGALERFQHWERIAGQSGQEGGGEGGEIVPLRLDGRSEAPPSFGPGDAPPPRGRRMRHWVLAASCATLAIAAGGLGLHTRGQVIETERGERREVALADGSVLQVDPATRVRIKFDERERRVFISNGRALFRVASNPDRPFLVQSDGTIVRAVGTAFGVERRGRSTVVTVAEGKVAVSGDSRLEREPDAAARAVAAAPIVLAAGQQVTVARAGSIEPVREVDLTRALAWAEGRLVFDNHTVAQVIAEFNRYNRVRLRVTDEQLAQRPVSGVFDAADPESFIQFVSTATPIRVRREADREISISLAR